MTRDPDQRPASAAAFGRALQGIETELGHLPTDFEVADDGAQQRVRPAAPDDEESTRAARLQVVRQRDDRDDTALAGSAGVDIVGVPTSFNEGRQPAVLPIPSVAVPEAPAAAETVARQAREERDDTTEDADRQEDAGTRPAGQRRMPVWALSVAAVTLVALVGVIVLLARGSSDERATTTTTVPVDEDGLVTIGAPVLPSTVEVMIEGTTVTVSWVPGNGALDTDRYLVTLTDGTDEPSQQVVDGTEAVFEVEPGVDRACAVIEARRDTRASTGSTRETCSE